MYNSVVSSQLFCIDVLVIRFDCLFLLIIDSIDSIRFDSSFISLFFDIDQNKTKLNEIAKGGTFHSIERRDVTNAPGSIRIQNLNY